MSQVDPQSPAQAGAAQAVGSAAHHPKDSVDVAVGDLALAFEAWENGFRAEPDKFMSAEECAAAQVSALSARRADYFMALLKAMPGVDFYPNLLKVDEASHVRCYAALMDRLAPTQDGAA